MCNYKQGSSLNFYYFAFAFHGGPANPYFPMLSFMLFIVNLAPTNTAFFSPEHSHIDKCPLSDVFITIRCSACKWIFKLPGARHAG